MPLRPVEYLSDGVIAERAVRLIRAYERKRRRPISLPIPVETLVEHVLGLRIAWVEIEERQGEIILARMDPDFEGHPTIQMNERRREHFEEYIGTESYSIGHEAGHWDLHYDDNGDAKQMALWGADTGGVVNPERTLCRRMGDGDRREFQAERFAAHLLMPEYLMRPVAAGRDLYHWGAIAKLARDCGVSKRAMTRRLEELRLVQVGSDNQLRPPDGAAGMRRMF